MQAYIATVKILIAAPSPTDACDIISAALTDPINTALVDWGYIPQTPDTCTSGCPHTEGAQSGSKCRCQPPHDSSLVSTPRRSGKISPLATASATA